MCVVVLPWWALPRGLVVFILVFGLEWRVHFRGQTFSLWSFLVRNNHAFRQEFYACVSIR